MDQLEKYKETGCIPVLDIGYAYNKGRQDYLASSVPLNLNEGWALKFNKYLCKQ
jgi:hypothetical protein